MCGSPQDLHRPGCTQGCTQVGDWSHLSSAPGDDGRGASGRCANTSVETGALSAHLELWVAFPEAAFVLSRSGDSCGCSLGHELGADCADERNTSKDRRRHWQVQQ